MEFIPTKILPALSLRGIRIYVGRGAGLILKVFTLLGVRTIFAMPDPVNAQLIAAARSARRKTAAINGGVPRLRILEPGCDRAFETIRFSFESEKPPVLWLSAGFDGLAVLPALRVALRSRVPLLVVSPSLNSQVPCSTAAASGHRRLIRHANLFEAFCKRRFQIDRLADCQKVFAQAESLAAAEPAGPVHIEIGAALLSRWTARRLRTADEPTI
ncbi:MAG: thiamine pyrophosphate-binding protein [Leptospirales bacterium]|jgi:hypothetical protein